MHKYKILYNCKQNWSHSVIIKINVVLKNMREINILHIGDYVSTKKIVPTHITIRTNVLDNTSIIFSQLYIYHYKHSYKHRTIFDITSQHI